MLGISSLGSAPASMKMPSRSTLSLPWSSSRDLFIGSVWSGWILIGLVVVHRA